MSNIDVDFFICFFLVYVRCIRCDVVVVEDLDGF